MLLCTWIHNINKYKRKRGKTTMKKTIEELKKEGFEFSKKSKPGRKPKKSKEIQENKKERSSRQIGV